MKSFHSKERGTSVAEFLIFAPFLMFLIYGMFFLHESIDDSIELSVTNRTVLFQGQIQVLPAPVVTTTKVKPNALEESKAVNYAHTFSYGNSTDEGSKLLSSHVKDTPKKFDSIYATMDRVAGTALTAAILPRKAFYGLVHLASGMKANDSIRISNLENISNFDESDLMKGFLTLETDITKKPASADEFHRNDKLYLNDLNNYHPIDGIRSAFSGYGMGLLKHKHWGSKGDFDDDSAHFVTRCMARFTQEETCENKPKIFGSRAFAIKLAALISAKVAFSGYIMVQTIGLGSIVEAVLLGAVKDLISDVVSSRLSELANDIVTSMMKNNVNFEAVPDTGLVEKSYENMDSNFSNLINFEEGV